MMRLIGAAGIFLASLGVSRFFCSVEREKMQCAEAFLELIRQIDRHIVCFNRPFPEIVRLLDPELRVTCRLSPTGENLEVMFDAASPPLPAGCERIVREFAHELGRSYRDEQIAACAAAISALDAETAAERRRLAERIRLIRGICLCGGLAVIILLI